MYFYTSKKFEKLISPLLTVGEIVMVPVGATLAAAMLILDEVAPVTLQGNDLLQ